MASYLSKIDARISQIEQEMASLQSEIEELRIASRVINRLGADDDAVLAPARIRTVVERKAERQGLRLVDQIEQVLSDGGAMKLSEIHSAIEQLRPGTQSKVVSSLLSRMKADNITKHADDGLWSLCLKNDEPLSQGTSGSVGNGHGSSHGAFEFSSNPG